MAWIRIEQSLVQNRKLYSLKSALRIDTAKAVGTLALLWLWAIDNARGGSLGRISDRQLAEICQFSPRRAAELRDALREAMKRTGPVLIDAQIDKDERVLPMIPAGGTVDDLVTE